MVSKISSLGNHPQSDTTHKFTWFWARRNVVLVWKALICFYLHNVSQEHNRTFKLYHAFPRYLHFHDAWLEWSVSYHLSISVAKSVLKSESEAIFWNPMHQSESETKFKVEARIPNIPPQRYNASIGLASQAWKIWD